MTDYHHLTGEGPQSFHSRWGLMQELSKTRKLCDLKKHHYLMTFHTSSTFLQTFDSESDLLHRREAPYFNSEMFFF